MNSVSVGHGTVLLTYRFFAISHPPVGHKMSLVNYKYKITTSANYTDHIGTGYKSHDKKCVCTVKDLKTTSTCTDQRQPVVHTVLYCFSKTYVYISEIYCLPTWLTVWSNVSCLLGWVIIDCLVKCFMSVRLGHYWQSGQMFHVC